MISKKLGAADPVALFYCTLTIKYMRVLARFVFRYGVLCLGACFLVLWAFYADLERLQVFRILCGSFARVLFSCVLGADLAKISGCNRRGSCARLPVCRFVSVSGSGCPAGCADPLRVSVDVFRIHCATLYYCISRVF